MRQPATPPSLPPRQDLSSSPRRGTERSKGRRGVLAEPQSAPDPAPANQEADERHAELAVVDLWNTGAAPAHSGADAPSEVLPADTLHSGAQLRPWSAGPGLQLAHAGSLPAVAAPSAGAASDAATALAPSWSGTSATGLNLGLPILLGSAALAGSGASHSSGPASPPVVRPQIGSITASAAADTVTLRFDMPLDGQNLPERSQFGVAQGSRTFGVARMTLSADGLQLTLALDGDLTANPFSLRYTDLSAGDDAQTLQSRTGVDVADFQQGLVADGLIAGARIYIDANRDGIAQDSEFSGVTTDRFGRYVLSGPVTGPLIATGGVNIDTGIFNTLVLKAPEGATVVNPLTTLVQSLSVQRGVSARQASTQLATSLGLDGLDLSNFDPLAAGETPTGLAAQKIAAQVAMLVQSLAAGQAQSSAVMDTLATLLVSHTPSNLNQPVLSQPALIQALMTQAQVPSDQQGSRLSTLQGMVDRIDGAPSISAISTVQASAGLDTTAPTAPSITMVLPTSLGDVPKVVVGLHTDNSTGRGALAGHLLTVTVDGQTYTHTLTGTDIARGRAEVAVPMNGQMLNAQATLTDLAGNVSSAGVAATPGGDTVELGAQLALPIQGLLQTLGNQELPLLGPLNEFTQSLWGELRQWLQLMPTARLVAGSPRPRPLAGLELSDLTGGASEPSYTLVFDDTSIPDSSALPPWMQPVDEDNDQSDAGGGTSGGTGSTGGTGGTGSTDGGGTVTPTVRVLQGRNTGQQFEIPDLSVKALKEELLQAYSQNLETGDFRFNLKLPFRILQKDTLGEVGVDGAQARIDASFDSYGQLEINLEGKFDAKKYAVFNTQNSKLELSLDGGLKQGSQFALQLGPMVVAASDLASPRIESQTERQNTGLTASVTAYLKDNDGKPNDRLEFSPKTIATLFNEISEGNFKISDWYDLQVKAAGQLSAQALGRVDMQWLLPKPQDLAQLVKDSQAPQLLKDLAQLAEDVSNPIYSLLTMLAPQVSAKILVPASLSYDSRLKESAFKSEYGKVYFDDIQIGAQTLMSSYMEPGLNLLNRVMAPLYLVEDLVNAPLELPAASSLFKPYTPPGSWPNWLGQLASDIVNAPGELTDQVLTRLQTGLDRNKNGQITVFEALRGTVDGYHKAAMDIALFWGQVNKVEGVGALLTSAGKAVQATTGVDLIGVLRTVADAVTASVTRPPKTEDDPNPLSPMDRIQLALDTAEQIFSIIGQLQDLQQLYEAAQADLQRLSGVNSTALSFKLGSYVWDIGNNAFNETRNAYESKPIEYNLPSSAAQVAQLTQQEAIKIIFDTVKAGRASPSTLSVELFQQAGVDFNRLTAYKDDKLDSGVNLANFKALCDILNNLQGRVFTKDKDWTDSSLYDDGKLKTADSFTQDLTEIAEYNRLWRLASKQGDFQGRDAKTITDTLFALGVITPADREVKKQVIDAEMGWYEDFYMYGDEAGSYILYDILKAQKVEDIDTASELKALWAAQKKIENLTGNRTTAPVQRDWQAFGPGYDEVSGYKLSFDDFARIGLPILSRSEKVREAANYEIWDIPGYSWWNSPTKFKKLYPGVAKIINDENTRWRKSNGADGDGLMDNAIQKFMAAAGTNGNVQQIDMADFQALGLSQMQSSQLAFFRNVLAADVINAQEVNSVANITKVVDAINTITRTANDQTIEAKAFYSAIELLLGEISLGDFTRYPDTKNSYAQVLNYIPRANAGGINQLYSTESLPLFQDIVKRLDPVQVDTHEELLKLADITKDILLTSMKADKVWDTHKLVYTPTDLNDKIIEKFKNYKSTLSAADLKLLGYQNVDATAVEAVKSALADFNKNVDGSKYTAYSGGDYRSFTTYAARATKLKPLDLNALDTLVGDYTNSGFFTELLALSPPLKKFWDAFRGAGFDLPFVSDPAFLQKLWTQQPLDLVTFKPTLPSLDTGNIELFNVDLIKAAGLDTFLPGFTSPLKTSFSANIQPRLSFGIDTGGLIEAGQLPQDTDLLSWDVLKALLNGLYINDRYPMGESLVDLPELNMDLALDGLLGLNFGKVDSLFHAFAQVSSSLQLNANFDLNDEKADEYGKVRAGDLLGLLFSDPLSVGDLNGSLTQDFKAQARAVLDLTPDDWGFLAKDTSGFKGLTEAVASALNFLGWSTTYTLVDLKGETSITWMDSDPSTPAPSLLEFVDEIKSLAQSHAVL